MKEWRDKWIEVFDDIPKTVGMRLRRLCSDRVEGDRIFADALDEYQAYMQTRGYDPMNIHGHFVEIANLKRQDALKKVERRKKKWKERPVFFVEQQEPALPSIEKSIRKHLKLLHRDSELKELYPRNLFITSYKRPKNLKELLCPSKLMKKKQGIINNGKSFIRCENECKTCERINPSGKFISKTTGRNFTSRIEATPYIIYLITCGICGKQGVG